MPQPAVPQGVWPVMLTTFREDRSIDWPAVDALTEWYLAARPAGLFAVSGSSEVYALSNPERLDLASRVVARTGGRVPVVASAITSDPIDRQAELIRAMAGTGVQAVILATCQLAARDEDDGAWRGRLEGLLAATGDVPLGLYEIPRPYKRLLCPELLAWAASTGRFCWLKDTCCEMPAIRAKIRATRGTPLRFFNAHTPLLLESLVAGGDGFCGVGANYFPSLYVWLCRHFCEQPDAAGAIQGLLTEFDELAEKNYPLLAKTYLTASGLPMTPVCRYECPPLDPSDWHAMEAFAARARELSRAVGAA